MKNLKQIKRLTLMLTVCMVSFYGCTDKLEENDGQLSADDLDFTKTEDMVLPLIGAYAEVYKRGWEDPILVGVRGDDVNAGGVGDAQNGLTEADLYSYDNNYWMFNQVWSNFYGDIVDVVNSKETIERYKEFATGSDVALADQYIAEANVLSGYQHLQMSRMWSDIFIITSSSVSEDIDNGIDTKAEVMQYVSDLMDESIPFLPDSRPNERTDIRGGVTKYTALAVKAMAQLELENYQAVADVCSEIINSDKFMLYGDFYELFKKEGQLSNESLFEFQFSDYNSDSGDVNNHLFAPFGPPSWTPAVDGASGGWGFYEPSLKYIKFMIDRGDQTRLVTSVCFTPRGLEELTLDPDYATLPGYISTTTPDGDTFNDTPRFMFASGKHYWPSTDLTPGRNSYGSGKNFIVIRYAEILLMYAEALTHGASGSGMTADQAVNLVRGRVGMGNLSGVTTDMVIDEKFAELGMEWGIRYYDMIRLNKYDELSYDGRTFTADKEYLRYPQDQLDLLPLEEN